MFHVYNSVQIFEQMHIFKNSIACFLKIILWLDGEKTCTQAKYKNCEIAKTCKNIGYCIYNQ